MATIFLITALIVAVVEAAVALWAKTEAARKVPAVTESAIKQAPPGFDPAKVLEALKGVLEALKGLPAWVPIFLAGFALYWLATQQPEACKRPQPQQQRSEVNAMGSGQNSSQTNAQTPARPPER